MPINPESVSSMSLETVHSLGDHSHKHPKITIKWPLLLKITITMTAHWPHFCPHLFSLYMVKHLWALPGYALSILLPPKTLNASNFHSCCSTKQLLTGIAASPWVLIQGHILPFSASPQQNTQFSGFCAVKHSPLSFKIQFLLPQASCPLLKLSLSVPIWTKLSYWLCDLKYSV